MVAGLESIAEQIRAGEHEAARRTLDSVEETEENRVQAMFLRGLLQEMEYDRAGALATYQRVLEESPGNAEAAFRAALLCDLGGDDDTAIELYEQCTVSSQAPVNALLNLAVLYEDHGHLADAEAMLKSVLAAYPNHFRAAHFLASVQSSRTMVFDEQQVRDREKRSAVMDQPISDFELSVRSRNCLRQMNVRTLGDLLQISEAELLSYKNFGETSLSEIRTLLEHEGLHLGQGLQPAHRPAPPPPVEMPADAADYLDKPVSELELSVRSRKCLQRLGIVTVGELASHTENDLMTAKNFGQTSLAEIQQQLAQFGLSLRHPG